MAYMFQKILLLLLLFFSTKLAAQDYGLEFMGHEVIPDHRTSLTIGEKKKICFDEDFELCFDIKFKKNVVSYFGYVFRIVNDDGQNVDLLFNARKDKKFRIVNRDLIIATNFGLDSAKLYSTWSRMKFKFNAQNSEMSLYLGERLIEKKQISFNPKACFRIYFGGNKDNKFSTKDALPMYIRDISLLQGSKEIYSWNLKEVYGNIATEALKANSGEVTNGFWLLKRHYEWINTIDTSFGGQAVFYFDKKLQNFVIHSDASRIYFDTKTSAKIVSHLVNKHPKFTFGDQAYYIASSKNAVNVRLSHKEIFGFDSKNNSWSIPPNLNPELTEYWHHNGYLFPQDTALVLIGGYGQFTYKNEFQKYSFGSKGWSELKMIGDQMEPRYLFGIGNTKDRLKSYILGGFGSKTGEQEINPQNYYDLLEINWKNNAIRKLYTLEAPKAPFVVVKSMVIDEKNGVYYALIYNQLIFKSSLQLIKGSLNKPEYTLLGKPIPYDFQDVASTADLAFDEQNQKLVCITYYYDRLKFTSYLRTYSLDFPPTNLQADSDAEGNTPLGPELMLGLSTILLIGLGLRLYFLRKTKSLDVLKKAVSVENNTVLPTKPSEELLQETEKNKLILFGGFQFMTAKGEDLTVHFTPLLKELFLYMLLNSIKWNKSVNSNQLNELFWYDKTTSSARNNRSVNLTKLKVLFEQVGHIHLSKESGDWQIIFDPNHLFVDYADFLKLTDEKKALNKEEINHLTRIVSRGNFLFNLEYEWLEPFKSEISNRVIDTYTAYTQNLSLEHDAQEIIEIADKIFVFDKVDETAMEMKCKALVYLGKHSLAQKCHEHFEKEYHLLYAEKFEKSFKQIINGI
jgi:two-component SAPR family response regulator